MTLYDLINWEWSGENFTVIADFRSSLLYATRSAIALHSDSVSYYLHELECYRRMYSACNPEKWIPWEDIDKISRLVWRVYRRHLRAAKTS